MMIKPMYKDTGFGKLVPTAVNNTADYCSILADPFDEFKNARIPDECNLPSRVVALYDEGVLTVNSNGCTGINIRLDKLGTGCTYFKESSASTDAVIAFDGAIQMPGNGSLNAIATRIVAAGIKIESQAGDGYNGGTIYSVARNRFEAAAAIAVTSTTSFTSQRMNGFGAVKNGGFATYRPIDTSDSDYASAGSVVGALQLHVSLGLYPASTVVPPATFKFKIVVHYEILPSADTENGPGEYAYGPHDPRAAKVVDQLARTIPPVGGGSDNESVSSMFSKFSNFVTRQLRNATSTASLAAGGAAISSIVAPSATRRMLSSMRSYGSGSIASRSSLSSIPSSLSSARFSTPARRIRKAMRSWSARRSAPGKYVRSPYPLRSRV